MAVIFSFFSGMGFSVAITAALIDRIGSAWLSFVSATILLLVAIWWTINDNR